jgi:hypothetical protein
MMRAATLCSSSSSSPLELSSDTPDPLLLLLSSVGALAMVRAPVAVVCFFALRALFGACSGGLIGAPAPVGCAAGCALLALALLAPLPVAARLEEDD